MEKSRAEARHGFLEHGFFEANLRSLVLNFSRGVPPDPPGGVTSIDR